MSREQDPSVGDIGNIEVEDPRAGKNAGKSRKGGGGGPRKPAGGPGRSGGSGGQGAWMLVSLALLALVLVLGAWTYGEITSLQKRLDKAVERSSQRLDNLESLLSATDETLSQSANSIQGRLKTHMSEIRKLWDVSNKRNRRWIKDNEQKINSLQTSVTGLEKKLGNVSAALDQLHQRLKDLVNEQGKTQTQVELLADTVQQLEQTDVRLEKRLNELQDLREQWKALDKRLKRVDERLKRMDSAIDAFDAYRRQVNQRLQALEEQQGTGP